MWERIEETVDRAVSGIVYNIWGEVGVSTGYDRVNNQLHLIIYDKSYKCDDKKEVVNEKFDFNLESMSKIQAKIVVIEAIEKYLIENYS